jgi:type II secretory pathway pseudopilin PulG
MSAFFDHRRRKPRRGYTLVELLVSMSTGALLLAGLTSSLYISTQTLTPDATATSESNRSSLALRRIAADLRLALNFTERTATAVTFTVPDRTGDGNVDTIRYSWSGVAGNPLYYQFNSGQAVAVATNVQAFNLSQLTRSLSATTTPLSSTIVAYPTPPEAKVSAGGSSITIARPSGLVPDNLMVAAVAIRGAAATTVTAPSGWTLISSQDNGSNGCLAVWWKTAGAAEATDFTFGWTGPFRAYGYIMRFGAVETSAPINAWATATGPSSLTPLSPAVTTTKGNAMIVRLGAFQGDSVTVDNAGVASHITLPADSNEVGATAVSGAAAYATQATAGSSGTATFTLTVSQPYTTTTIALAPDDGL